jgi:hypothetical protein
MKVATLSTTPFSFPRRGYSQMNISQNVVASKTLRLADVFYLTVLPDELNGFPRDDTSATRK